MGWEDPLEKESYPLQYSGLENSTDYIVHRAAKSQTRLSEFQSQDQHHGKEDKEAELDPGKTCTVM